MVDFFIRTKSGASFYHVVEIIQHLDIVLSKAVLKGREDVFLKKILGMIQSDKEEFVQGGLGIMSNAITIDDLYIEKFMTAGGLNIVAERLKRRVAMQECFMVVLSISHARPIYRQRLLEHNLFGQLLQVAQGRRTRSEYGLTLALLATLLAESDDSQLVFALNKGLLDIIVLYAPECSRNSMVYGTTSSALKRVLRFARKNEGKKGPWAKVNAGLAYQKLYELNAYQVFEKMFDRREEFAEEYFVHMLHEG